MRKTLITVFLLLLVSFAFTIVPLQGHVPAYDRKEMYEPALSRLNSLDKLETYIDSSAAAAQIAAGTMNHLLLMEEVLKRRFYHGFSQLTARQNWIAAVCDRVFDYGLVNKVLPDDMLQHDYAACSQQCLIMQELLKRKGISYRVLRFDHHYALEAQVNGGWYFFDPNMEPDITPAGRSSSAWKYAADSLKKYYDPVRFNDLDYKFGTGKMARVGTENENSALRAAIFQRVTGLLSSLTWLLPLFVFALMLFYVRLRGTSPVKPGF